MSYASEIKYKRNAWLLSVFIHSLIMLLFLFIGLKEPDPPIEERGMPLTIRLGFEETGKGEDFDTPETTQSVEQNEPKVSENKAPQNVVTDNTKQTVQVPKTEEVQKQEIKKPGEENPTPKEEPKKTEEEMISEDLKRKLEKFKGKSSTSETGGGNQQNNGTQGKEYGSKTGGDMGGAIPGGGSYLLSGRKLVSLPNIYDDSPDEGKVVVDIIVDRKGNVIKATPGAKGTNTSSTNLFKKAQEGAYKTKFSPNADAPEEQVGTITFIFKLGN